MGTPSETCDVISSLDSIFVLVREKESERVRGGGGAREGSGGGGRERAPEQSKARLREGMERRLADGAGGGEEASLFPIGSCHPSSFPGGEINIPPSSSLPKCSEFRTERAKP